MSLPISGVNTSLYNGVTSLYNKENLYALLDLAKNNRVTNAVWGALGHDLGVSQLKQEVTDSKNMSSGAYEGFMAAITDLGQGTNEGLFHGVSEVASGVVSTIGIALTVGLGASAVYKSVKNKYIKGFDEKVEKLTYDNNNSSRLIKYPAWAFGIAGGIERNEELDILKNKAKKNRETTTYTSGSVNSPVDLADNCELSVVSSREGDASGE